MSILLDTEFYQGKGGDDLILDEMISTFTGGMKTV
jgi:hypothetical protein